MTRSIVLVSSAAALSILVHSSAANAVDCFIDSVGGDNNNTGLSEDQAVKSQTSIPSSCTVAKYKRGSVFNNEAVRITNNVKTYTNYGNCADPLPKFVRQRSPNNGSMLQAYQGGITVDGLYLAGSMSDASMSNLMNGICVMIGSNSKILNCEITNCDIGIMVSGTGTLVQGNYVHDLFVSVDAAPGVDPNQVGGAEGIFVNGSNNEVAYNAFVGCRSDAEWTGGSCDGGATEVTVGANGATLSGVKIHHNFSYQSCGFFEVSSMAGSAKGNFTDSEFYDNVSIDSGWLMLLQVNNTNLSNIKWDNNTVVQRSGSLNAGMLVTVFTATSSGMTGGSLAQDVVSMTNNLVVFDGVNVFGTPIPTEVKQLSNLIVNSQASAVFQNLAGSTAADFDLAAGSPAIDVGSASGRTLDFLNRTAPAGSAMDVGAFEFGAALAAGYSTPVPPNVAVNGCSTTGGTSGTGGSAATGGTTTTSTGGTTTSTGGTTTSTGGTSATGGSGGEPATETCNCRTAGESSGSGRGPVGLLALAASLLFRRRRPRKAMH